MLTPNIGDYAQGIIQMAYVVEDLRESIREWSAKLNIGPWLVCDHFIGEHGVYRGQNSRAAISLASSFCGHMNIELIQPDDTNPSVYTETIHKRGYGFHHWGIASSDVDADIRRYEAKGMPLVFRVSMSECGDVAFMDTGEVLPGFIELIQMSPEMEQGFSQHFAVAKCWDGSDPIRYSL
jgi:hypothetical protein